MCCARQQNTASAAPNPRHRRWPVAPFKKKPFCASPSPCMCVGARGRCKRATCPHPPHPQQPTSCTGPSSRPRRPVCRCRRRPAAARSTGSRRAPQSAPRPLAPAPARPARTAWLAAPARCPPARRCLQGTAGEGRGVQQSAGAAVGSVACRGSAVPTRAHVPATNRSSQHIEGRPKLRAPGEAWAGDEHTCGRVACTALTHARVFHDAQDLVTRPATAKPLRGVVRGGGGGGGGGGVGGGGGGPQQHGRVPQPKRLAMDRTRHWIPVLCMQLND